MSKRLCVLQAFFFLLYAPNFAFSSENKGLCSPNETNHHRAFFGISGLDFEKDKFSSTISDIGSAVVSYSAIEKVGTVQIGFPDGSNLRLSVSPQRIIHIVGNNMFIDDAVCENFDLTDSSRKNNASP